MKNKKKNQKFKIYKNLGFLKNIEYDLWVIF